VTASGLIYAAAVLAALGVALLALARRAERFGRGGPAVTYGVLGAWADSGAFSCALGACYVIGSAR
jgi:hypothetical protein